MYLHKKIDPQVLMFFLILFFNQLILTSCKKEGNYNVTLLEDYSVLVTTADGVKQIFKPDFMVLANDEDPNKMLRRGDFNYIMPEGTDQGLLYNVPT